MNESINIVKMYSLFGKTMQSWIVTKNPKRLGLYTGSRINIQAKNVGNMNILQYKKLIKDKLVCEICTKIFDLYGGGEWKIVLLIKYLPKKKLSEFETRMKLFSKYLK